MYRRNGQAVIGIQHLYGGGPRRQGLEGEGADGECYRSRGEYHAKRTAGYSIRRKRNGRAAAYPVETYSCAAGTAGNDIVRGGVNADTFYPQPQAGGPGAHQHVAVKPRRIGIPYVGCGRTGHIAIRNRSRRLVDIKGGIIAGAVGYGAVAYRVIAAPVAQHDAGAGRVVQNAASEQRVRSRVGLQGVTPAPVAGDRAAADYVAGAGEIYRGAGAVGDIAVGQRIAAHIEGDRVIPRARRRRNRTALYPVAAGAIGQHRGAGAVAQHAVGNQGVAAHKMYGVVPRSARLYPAAAYSARGPEVNWRTAGIGDAAVLHPVARTADVFVIDGTVSADNPGHGAQAHGIVAGAVAEVHSVPHLVINKAARQSI